jgi:RNA polymerase sigma-70 factor (ECF subfamily)
VEITPEEIEEAYEAAYKACNYYKSSFKIYNFNQEDIVQDAMFKVVKNRHTFRGESKFRTWVYRITCNTILNAMTAARIRGDEYKVRKEFIEEDVKENESYSNIFFDFKDSSVEAQMLNEERKKLVLGMIEGLPEHLRYVLISRLRGVSYTDLAEELRIPTGTVRTRVFTAKKKLIERAKHHEEYF